LARFPRKILLQQNGHKIRRKMRNEWLRIAAAVIAVCVTACEGAYFGSSSGPPVRARLQSLRNKVSVAAMERDIGRDRRCDYAFLHIMM
jgi:hypothetical protein